MSAHRVVPISARTWSEGQMHALYGESFPAFIVADEAVHPHVPRVRDVFGSLDLTVVDRDDQPVATGWGVPLAWAGDPGDLPDTSAEVLERALELYDTGGPADNLAIGGAVVHPAHKGTALAESLLRSLADAATAHGLDRVVAPVRPTRKDHYPLMPMEFYAAWTRDDGLPWDP